MTVLGCGVLRANRWTGWCRATPLYCGLTPILVELPVFVVLGPQPLAIAVTWVAWLPFGFALLVRSGRLSVTRTLN